MNDYVPTVYDLYAEGLQMFDSSPVSRRSLQEDYTPVIGSYLEVILDHLNSDLREPPLKTQHTRQQINMKSRRLVHTVNPKINSPPQAGNIYSEGVTGLRQKYIQSGKRPKQSARD